MGVGYSTRTLCGLGGGAWTCSLYVGKCYKLAVRPCAATWPHSDAQGDGAVYTTSSSGGDRSNLYFFSFCALCPRDDARGVSLGA